MKVTIMDPEYYWLYKQIMRLGSWYPALAPGLFCTFRHGEAELMEEISIISFFTFDILNNTSLFLGSNNIDLDSFKQSWMWTFPLTINNCVRNAEGISSFDDCGMCFPYDLPKTATSSWAWPFSFFRMTNQAQIWTGKITGNNMQIN